MRNMFLQAKSPALSSRTFRSQVVKRQHEENRLFPVSKNFHLIAEDLHFGTDSGKTHRSPSRIPWLRAAGPCEERFISLYRYSRKNCILYH